MLCVEGFFTACTVRWKTEKIYHYPWQGEVESSYTEFNVDLLTSPEKHQISSAFIDRSGEIWSRMTRGIT
jgi:hypothetical protein